MPISCEIRDSDLQGFSLDAKTQVKIAMNEYAKELLEETKTIERRQRIEPGSNAEATASIVLEAKGRLRRIRGPKPATWNVRIIRCLAGILPFIAGMEYVKSTQQSLSLVLVSAFAILFLVLSLVRE